MKSEEGIAQRAQSRKGRGGFWLLDRDLWRFARASRSEFRVHAALTLSSIFPLRPLCALCDFAVISSLLPRIGYPGLGKALGNPEGASGGEHQPLNGLAAGPSTAPLERARVLRLSSGPSTLPIDRQGT